MEVDVNFLNVNRQHKNIDMKKVSTFPPHIKIENDISCLKQFNNFMKNVSFTIDYCYVCDEKKFIQELIICNISYLNTTLKNMNTLLKLNSKHHVSNDYDMIPQ
jgi:hypothetical protein